MLEEHLRRAPKKAPGTLAHFLERKATPAERKNLTDLVSAVEDFEAARGLAPQKRLSEPDGCVTVRLGPSLRVELRFRVAE